MSTQHETVDIVVLSVSLCDVPFIRRHMKTIKINFLAADCSLDLNISVMIGPVSFKTIDLYGCR